MTKNKTYLQLFYEFCKKYNLTMFISKTFDNDIKKIRKGENPFEMDLSFYKMAYLPNKDKIIKPFIIDGCYDLDKDEHEFYKFIIAEETEYFFPETLLGLLRYTSRYSNQIKFCIDYWKRTIFTIFLHDKITEDFSNFINCWWMESTLSKEEKFNLLKMVEQSKYLPSYRIFIVALKTKLSKLNKNQLEKQKDDLVDEFLFYQMAWRQYLLKLI